MSDNSENKGWMPGEIDKLVDAGLAEWVPGGEGEMYLRLKDDGATFIMTEDGSEQVSGGTEAGGNPARRGRCA